jgi:hypothetical protein
MKSIITNPLLPELPKTKKELLERIPPILQNSYLILPQCGSGTGAVGTMLELLLGSQGKNKAFADSCGIEVKFNSPNNLLTMFHKEVFGGEKSILPLVKQFGKIDKDGRRSFRHTVKDSSPYFNISRKNNQIIVEAINCDLMVYWHENDVIKAISKKLDEIIVVQGSVTTDKITKQKVASYDAAWYCKNIDFEYFWDNILNHDIVVDFDVREKTPDSNVLRNHGTKFRMYFNDKFRKMYKTCRQIIPANS